MSARVLTPPKIKIEFYPHFNSRFLNYIFSRCFSGQPEPIRRSALPGKQQVNREVQVFLLKYLVFCRVLFSEELFTPAQVAGATMEENKMPIPPE